jgi:nucleotide-binding universal stress UspA family protein
MNRIAVGVYGSPAASAAARWADREAEIRSLALAVVHVVAVGAQSRSRIAWPATVSPAAFSEGEVAQGQKILHHALGVIAKTTGPRKSLRITAKLCFGALIPTLCRLTRKSTQMIVIGRGGRNANASTSARIDQQWSSQRRPLPGGDDPQRSTIANPTWPRTDRNRHWPPLENELAVAVGFDEASRRAVAACADSFPRRTFETR